MRAKLKEVKEQLQRRRHQPIPDQGKWLSASRLMNKGQPAEIPTIWAAKRRCLGLDLLEIGLCE